MNKRWLIGAAVLVFVGTLLGRLPASWLLPLLPAQVHCTAADGSLWNGHCADLSVAQLRIGDTQWKLAALPLLLGRLVLQISADGDDIKGSGTFRLGLGGSIEARDTHAQFPLDTLQLPLPQGWSAHAALTLRAATLKQLQLQSLDGELQILDLQQQNPSLPLGDYALSFDPASNSNARFTGKLRDLKGPLSVNATLGVNPDLSWQIDGLVGARGDIPDDMRQVLQLMGDPDSSGRYSLSASGTL